MKYDKLLDLIIDRLSDKEDNIELKLSKITEQDLIELEKRLRE